MIGNNDEVRMIILQYGGISLDDYKGKAPEGYEAFSRAMMGGDAISCHLRRHPGESRREWGGCGR